MRNSTKAISKIEVWVQNNNTTAWKWRRLSSANDIAAKL